MQAGVQDSESSRSRQSTWALASRSARAAPELSRSAARCSAVRGVQGRVSTQFAASHPGNAVTARATKRVTALALSFHAAIRRASASCSCENVLRSRTCATSAFPCCAASHSARNSCSDALILAKICGGAGAQRPCRRCSAFSNYSLTDVSHRRTKEVVAVSYVCTMARTSHLTIHAGIASLHDVLKLPCMAVFGTYSTRTRHRALSVLEYVCMNPRLPHTCAGFHRKLGRTAVRVEYVQIAAMQCSLRATLTTYVGACRNARDGERFLFVIVALRKVMP